jgi:hypothetical protein
LSSGSGAFSLLAKVKYASGSSALSRPAWTTAKRKARPPTRTSVEARMLLPRVSFPKSSAKGAAMPARRGAADEERRYLFGEERLAPPSHPHEGGSDQGRLDEDNETFRAPEHV